MPISAFSSQVAASLRAVLTCAAAILLLAACSHGQAIAPGPTTAQPVRGALAPQPMRVADAPPPPKSAQSLDAAIVSMTVALLDRAQLAPPDDPAGHRLVIDPLIDRATGEQTGSTRAMEQRIGAVLRHRYPDIRLQPFDSASLATRPLILLGAITAVADAGVIPPTSAPQPKVYRIWAVLGDLRTGKVVSHETAWVQATEVDATRSRFDQDSPGWTSDTMTAAYLQTCAANAGDPIDPRYLAALQAQAMIADGIKAYEQGRYRVALAAYEAALAQPGGDQLRVHNGLYLSNRALRRRQAAEQAFGDVVDYGLDRGRLAVKFLFDPGEARLSASGTAGADYPMWLRQIAQRSAPRNLCLILTGHASTTGTAALNQRLSAERAETVRDGVVAQRPSLQARTTAIGVGATSPLVGTGRDDATDALDRRVEFNPERCES